MTATRTRRTEPVRASTRAATSRTAARDRSAPTSRPTATRTSSSSCCTPAATSRSRRSATWCGWTSRATSGRSSSRRRRTSSRCSGSTSTRCSPTARCRVQIAEQIERGRTIIVELDSLVPARHRGHQLPHRARQDLGRRRGDRPRARAAALLPQRRAVRARGRGLPRRVPARRTVSPASPAALHRARPLRRRRAGWRARSCARPRSDVLRRHLRAPPGEQPVRALRRAARRASCRRCSTAASTDYHAYAFATVRMVGAAFELAADHAPWLLGEAARAARRRRWARSSTAARCCRSAWRAGASSIRRRDRWRLADAWERAMESLAVAQTPSAEAALFTKLAG